ncbi:MAG: hypothetical protein IKS28_06240 [Clostridia bacterium]|nr:hypothetical protein [Clostridia bacterium]
MKFNFEKFPISFFNTVGMEHIDENTADMWRDLGITVGNLPQTSPENIDLAFRLLDKSEKYGLKVIVHDERLLFTTLIKKGEEEYRKGVRQVTDIFGGHPAVLGFFLGDEPDGTTSRDAFRAVKIVGEISPGHLPFLNLRPWNPVYGPNMSELLGIGDVAEYLDGYIKESETGLISYDCYSQCIGKSREESAENHGFDDYFYNLRKYSEASIKSGVPFGTCLCSFVHGWTRCDPDDCRWQLSTAVASGASWITWFIIQLGWVIDNWRDVPINQAGQRTRFFDYLSEANSVFNSYCGKIMPELTLNCCYHVNRAFGGYELFRPFGNILDVTCVDVNTKKTVPSIISCFHDKDGRLYYAFCCIGETGWADAAIKVRPGVKIEMCQVNNRFEPVGLVVEQVSGVPLDGQGSGTIRISTYTGQLRLYREA